MDIQATTVVSFNDGQESSYVFKIELDDVLNLDVNGDVKSSFSPSDTIYIKVNKSANVDILEVAVTDGNISNMGTDSRSGNTSNLFTAREIDEEDEFTIDYVLNSCAISYVGKQGVVEQSVSDLGQYKFIPNITKTPFISKFEYSYPVSLYKYIAPTVTLDEDETYDVGIVFYIRVR